MAQVACPWCEMELMPAVLERDEGECPECLTRWQFVDDEPVQELLLAA